MVDNHIIYIPNEDFEALCAELDRRPRENTQLRKFLETPSVLECPNSNSDSVNDEPENQHAMDEPAMYPGSTCDCDWHQWIQQNNSDSTKP